jgi:hypothetical protein
MIRVPIGPPQLKSLLFQSFPQTCNHPNLYAAARFERVAPKDSCLHLTTGMVIDSLRGVDKCCFVVTSKGAEEAL